MFFQRGSCDASRLQQQAWPQQQGVLVQGPPQQQGALEQGEGQGGCCTLRIFQRKADMAPAELE